jgi:uncharacterized protein (UPF0262 family)
MARKDQRISDITLDEHSVVRRSPQVEHERKAAIYDLIEDNAFSPYGDLIGPFKLVLRIEDNRLVFNVYDTQDKPLTKISLSLNAFRSLIREYLMVCESYYDAIDVGRRSLHNEGAQLLSERLRGKAEINEHTARRLFTLLCVLHMRG